MFDTTQQIDAAMRASFIFPLLGADERDRFIGVGAAPIMVVREAIFRMGDAGASMMLVEVGEVRISYPSAGRTVVLDELRPGSVFGELALIDGGERSADATAATNCRLLVFDRRAFVAMLEKNWPLAEALLKLVCARLRRADDRLADLAFSDLRSRLAKELLVRARPAKAGAPARVNDSQSALAALVGASRETVNRCLKAWERAGLVAMSDGRIAVLDASRLSRAGGLPRATAD